MKVSKNWLKEYLDLDGISDEALYDAISMHVCRSNRITRLWKPRG